MKTEEQVRDMKGSLHFARQAFADDTLFDQKTMYAINMLNWVLEEESTFKTEDFAKSMIFSTKQSEQEGNDI